MIIGVFFSILMRVAKAIAFLIVVTSVAFSSSGCSSDERDGEQLGISDTCNNPVADPTLDTLEVGLVENGRFAPFAEDEVVTLTYGVQGSAMIGLNISASGADVPECLGQITLVYEGEALAGNLFASLTMYAQDDGTSRTEIAWLVLFPDVLPGDRLILETEAGGQTYSRQIIVDEGEGEQFR